MNESPIEQIKSNLQQLRELIDNLGSTVNQQQQTLIMNRSDLMRQTAVQQSSDEVARLLVHVRRALEDLERRFKAQEKEQQQLKAFQEISAAVNSSLEVDEVLGEVMDAIIKLTQAERSILLLRNEETNELEIKVSRNIDQEAVQKSSFDISRSIVSSVYETGEPVVTMNAQSDPRFAAQESIISYNLRSILCVPLASKEKNIGVIYADNRVAAGIFGDSDRDLLAAFGDQAAVAIENARLFQSVREHLDEISEMRDLMENVFESIASGVITIDEENRISLYNQAAERILATPATSILAQTYMEAIEILRLPIGPLIDSVRQKGDLHRDEVDIVVSKRPGLTTVNLTLSPLRDTTQSNLGVAMVIDDVSEKKRLESVRRYLPPVLVDQVRDIDAAQRPQRRVMSVLFADVRGFSTYSENLDPEKLIQVINGYFTEAVSAITHFQGLTDKFMGDAVMALYNTPLNPQDDHPQRAIRTAWMISQSMAKYLEALPEERRLHFGFGIHTGEAVVGNVGSALRKDYSAIGDAVNLAKRIQENAAPDEILLSDATYQLVKDMALVEPLEPMQVKGRKALEKIYRLVGLQ